jgi:hypothetical protein
MRNNERIEIKINKKNLWMDSDEETKNLSVNEILNKFDEVKKILDEEENENNNNNNNNIENNNINNENNNNNNENNNNNINNNNNNNNNNTLNVELNNHIENEIINKIIKETQENSQLTGQKKFREDKYKLNAEEKKLYQQLNINPKEAHLFAKYIKEGKRIPRRGEVGITAEQIAYYESVGYVMSGSRHKKMNAIRQKIEGKVYSTEDKRALALFNLEESLKKEKNIIDNFKTIINNNNINNINNNK